MAERAPLYDRIGTTYASSRRADPRIAQALRTALADARTVLNVGAGTGAYEPDDLDVTALEPSSVMIAQRPVGSAAVIQGVAERIPLDDDSVDAAMLLGPVAVHPLPLPHDCLDGFYHAYWRRPHAYLDDAVRSNISVFRRLPAADVRRVVDQLRRDLDDGTWQQRHGSLLDRPELDLGLRVVVAERARG